MLPFLLIFALLKTFGPHPSKVQAELTRMNNSQNSHEAAPSAPQTEPQVKAWMPELTAEKKEMFVASIDKSGGENSCWVWRGPVCDTGYGRIYVGPKQTALTHRIAFALNNGPIPAGLCVMHKCDNPPCCNPNHLVLGTKSDNSLDMHNKGRGRISFVGEDAHNAKLTEGIVREIRERHTAGGVSYLGLSKQYGVSDGAIRNAIIRKCWKHVA